MNGLLSVAKVDTGDGDWTAGYTSESLGCAVSVWLADPCTPVPTLISGEDDIDPSAYLVGSFGIIAKMSRTNRCAEGTELEYIRSAVEEATELAAGKAFWEGFESAEMFLLSPDVETVAAGANVAETVAKVLRAFAISVPGVEPILHLGYSAALTVGDALNNEGNLKIGIQVAVSPGYPANGVAVTGPVLVRLSSVQALQAYDRDVNRTNIEANRLGAIEFDPCAAVRAITA
jgi:hypothetical protein